MPDASLVERFAESLEFRDANAKELEKANIDLKVKDSLGRLAIAFSDGVIEGEAGKADELLAYAESLSKPILKAPADEDKADAYKAFIDQIAGTEE